MKNKGMEKMVQYLKCQDFYKIESFLPRKGDEKAITKFCDDVKNGNYDECLIQNTQNYQPIFSKEDIISTLQALRNNRAGKKEVTQINTEKSQDESNKHNSNPQTSSNNRFVEDVKENISENATISGINHEIQHIKSKAIDYNKLKISMTPTKEFTAQLSEKYLTLKDKTLDPSKFGLNTPQLILNDTS